MLFVKAVSVLPLCGSGQTQFPLGLCFSTFLPACTNDILAILLWCCPPLFQSCKFGVFSECQAKLAAQALCFPTSWSLGTRARPVAACAFKDFSLHNVQPPWTPVPLRTTCPGSLANSVAGLTPPGQPLQPGRSLCTPGLPQPQRRRCVEGAGKVRWARRGLPCCPQQGPVSILPVFWLLSFCLLATPLGILGFLGCVCLGRLSNSCFQVAPAVPLPLPDTPYLSTSPFSSATGLRRACTWS